MSLVVNMERHRALEAGGLKPASSLRRRKVFKDLALSLVLLLPMNLVSLAVGIIAWSGLEPGF